MAFVISVTKTLKQMPLITCPDYGKDVSDAVPACIHCGRPPKKKTQPIIRQPLPLRHAPRPMEVEPVGVTNFRKTELYEAPSTNNLGCAVASFLLQELGQLLQKRYLPALAFLGRSLFNGFVVCVLVSASLLAADTTNSQTAILRSTPEVISLDQVVSSYPIPNPGESIAFYGCPTSRCIVSQKECTRTNLTKLESLTTPVHIAKKGNDYFWASRENRQLIHSGGGDVHYFIDPRGGGYVKIARVDNTIEFMEHVSLGLMTITYFGQGQSFDP